MRKIDPPNDIIRMPMRQVAVTIAAVFLLTSCASSSKKNLSAIIGSDVPMLDAHIASIAAYYSCEEEALSSSDFTRGYFYKYAGEDKVESNIAIETVYKERAEQAWREFSRTDIERNILERETYKKNGTFRIERKIILGKYSEKESGIEIRELKRPQNPRIGSKQAFSDLKIDFIDFPFSSNGYHWYIGKYFTDGYHYNQREIEIPFKIIDSEGFFSATKSITYLPMSKPDAYALAINGVNQVLDLYVDVTPSRCAIIRGRRKPIPGVKIVSVRILSESGELIHSK